MLLDELDCSVVPFGKCRQKKHGLQTARTYLPKQQSLGTTPHVLEAAVDPVDGAILLTREAQVLGLVVLADEVNHRVSVPDGVAHALLVGRAARIGTHPKTSRR